jgi:predicted nucleic acid-binding protein
MIVYFNASALLKRYISELGSTEANLLIAYAQAVATNLITRAEVPAAIMREDRMQILRNCHEELADQKNAECASHPLGGESA